MQAIVTHISALTYIQRARLLPSTGRVLVRPGQKVAATDPVAEGWMPGQHLLIDIRRTLNIAKIEQAEKLIVPKEGDHLKANEIIAQTKGIFAKAVRSPAEAEVITISNGQVLLELTGAPIKVLAGFAGTVKEVVKSYGAIIETHGALIQGIWGNDRFNQGLLLGVIQAPDEELTDQRLDVSMRGAIVYGGPCLQAKVLKVAEEMPLRGLVVSSLAPELVEQAELMSIPVVVVEGFGKIAFSSTAFKILSTSEKRDVCLKASRNNPFTGEHPEVILPLNAIGDDLADMVEIQAGLTVRIIGAPANGCIGAIVQIRPGSTQLPNGLVTPAANIRLENNEVVTIPLANLEIIQ